MTIRDYRKPRLECSAQSQSVVVDDQDEKRATGDDRWLTVRNQMAPRVQPNANCSQWCFGTRFEYSIYSLILLYINYSMVRYRVHAGSVWNSNIATSLVPRSGGTAFARAGLSAAMKARRRGSLTRIRLPLLDQPIRLLRGEGANRLIGLLDDADGEVRGSATRALRRITGRDFGADSSDSWRHWWETRK